MAAEVKITLDEMNTSKIVRLQGKIDAMSSPALEKKLMSLIDKEKKILVDCSKIEYLSSAGMRLLLSVTKKQKLKGGLIIFFGINNEISEIIKMAGFQKILQICPNESLASKIVKSWG